jgi:hypothetical protein
MRITRSDPRNLVIVDFPYLIGLIAVPMGLVLLGFGIAALYRAVVAGSGSGSSQLFGHGSGEIWGPLLGALISLGCGVGFTQRSEFTFDFVARTLTWTRRNLFGRSGGVVPLRQVRRALLDVHDSSDGGPTYNVVLQTDAGPLELSAFHTSGEARYIRIRDAINAALAVASTEAEQSDAEILALALAGRKMDAVVLVRTRYGYDLAQAKAFVEGLTA